MEELILNTNKKTTFDFDVVVEGVKHQPDAVRFVVEDPNRFDKIVTCERGSDTKWNVTVPPIQEKLGKKLTYRIEVIVDGLFFEPMKGDIVLREFNPRVSVNKVDKQPKVEPVVEKKEPVVEKKEPVVEKKEPVVEKEEPKKIPVKKPIIKNTGTIAKKPKIVKESAEQPKVIPSVEDKPIPPICDTLGMKDVHEDATGIPSLKKALLENQKRKDPEYLKERERKVRAVLDEMRSI